MWNVEWQSVGSCWWAKPYEGVGCWETGFNGLPPEVGAKDRHFPMSCTLICRLNKSMLLLLPIVSMTVADAGAVHIGVTVAMAMVAAVALGS